MCLVEGRPPLSCRRSQHLCDCSQVGGGDGPAEVGLFQVAVDLDPHSLRIFRDQYVRWIVSLRLWISHGRRFNANRTFFPEAISPISADTEVPGVRGPQSRVDERVVCRVVVAGVSEAVLLWGASFECRIFKESKQLLLCWTLCVHVAVSVEGMVDGNAGISFFSLKILKGWEGLGIRGGNRGGITGNASVWEVSSA